MSMLIFKLFLAFGIGGIGAYVGLKLKLPSALFIGPIVAIGIFQFFMGTIVERPYWSRVLIQLAAGMVIGTNFSKVTAESLKRLIRPALFIGMAMAGGGLGIGFLINYLTNIDLITCILGSTPGGQGEMAILAEGVGAETEKVIVLQLVRNQFALLVLLPAAKIFAKNNEKEGGKNPYEA